MTKSRQLPRNHFLVLRPSYFLVRYSTFDICSFSCSSTNSKILAIALLLCSGCGGTHESSVSGTVYLDEKPLQLSDTQGGNVTFYPSAGGAAAYGQMAADGTYQLSTGSEQGLKPGEYKVTVVVTDNPPPAAPGQAPPPGTPITPEKYSRMESTDLVVTVDSGSNSIDLRMESP